MAPGVCASRGTLIIPLKAFVYFERFPRAIGLERPPAVLYKVKHRDVRALPPGQLVAPSTGCGSIRRGTFHLTIPEATNEHQVVKAIQKL